MCVCKEKHYPEHNRQKAEIHRVEKGKEIMLGEGGGVERTMEKRVWRRKFEL